MKILVANLGSTSFKYRLFGMRETEETMLAKGGFERVEDFGQAIGNCLAALQKEGAIKNPEEIDAVGFKTVAAKELSGCVLADEKVLAALDDFKEVAPAHNPAYASGIRQFARMLPKAKLAALFETAFFQWVSEPARRYAVPQNWHEAGVRRYGYHGASHKFIAERSAELLGRDDVAERARHLYVDGPGDFTGKPLRAVSCHLGGSSSLAGIRDGAAIGASMGFSPQSGLPQNNRVGDLDSMAVPYVMKTLGLSLEEAERQMAGESGLLGLSGTGNDIREVHAAADKGDARAQLALNVYIHAIRHWLGAFHLQLGGLEALVFTAGIGENDPEVRAGVCAELEQLGIVLDHDKNRNHSGGEAFISTEKAPVKIMVIPANEELVVSRETQRLLQHLKP